MFKKILVAVDGSPTSNKGYKVAVELAKSVGAKLVVLHVIDERAVGIGLSASGFVAPAYVEDVIAALRDAGRKVLAKAQREAQAKGQAIDAHLVESLGNGVAYTILAQAKKQKADLVVLGTHGRRGLARVVVGSDAETVLREAAVPVLLVRAKS
ncbi:MAG: universal stress protein [Burkholderiales bacterium]